MIELKHNNVKFQIEFPILFFFFSSCLLLLFFFVILHPPNVPVLTSVLFYRGEDGLDMWVKLVY